MAPMFPPNLDDGELWLPAEIIPDIIGPHRPRHVSVEELACQLAALGLLTPIRYPARNPQPATYGFRAVTGLDAFGSASSTGFRVPAGGTGAFLPVTRTVSAQVGDLGRGRVLRRNAPVRAMPFRVIGSGKESGGTGVFLPRAVHHHGVNKSKSTSGVKQQQLVMAAAAEVALPQEWTY